MYTSLVFCLVLVTLTSATDDVITMDDGAGGDVVTGAEIVGQVLLSAKFLGLGLDRLSEQFSSGVVDELEALVKKLNGNYEMVTDGERRFFEDAIVKLAQAKHNFHHAKKSLSQLGSDIVTRVNSVRSLCAKTLSPSSTSRIQSAGIKFMIMKSTQMLKALMDPLEEAAKFQTSVVEELREADTYIGNFTAVLASMADTEGDRFKNMNKHWSGLYFGKIFSSKMQQYWAYVRPTLKGLQEAVTKSEATLSASEEQLEALSTLRNTLMTTGQKLGEKYEVFKSGAENSKTIDLDEFNAKYSIVYLERLSQAAQRLADI